MANVKVGIVEDEIIIAMGIIHALHNLGYETTEPAVSYTEGLGMIVSEQPDILLLDIQLKGHKDGIDLAWKVKEEYSLPFIFLTANSDALTVERVKKLNPPAFLVKPFNQNELYAAIEICLYNFASDNNKVAATTHEDGYYIKGSMFIRQGQSFHKIDINDILFLESENVYVNIHTANSKLLVRNSIQNYLELVADNRFFRVHKGYAVNTSQIESISGDYINMKNTKIPIGRVYRDALFNFLRIS